MFTWSIISVLHARSGAWPPSGCGHVLLGERRDLLAFDPRLTAGDPQAEQHVLPVLGRTLHYYFANKPPQSATAARHV